jgi:hypothetical protein
MDQWLELRGKYLHILLEMEGKPLTPNCVVCNKRGDIKCPDCFGAPLFCKGCCVKQHRHSPFHRPLQWTTTHYTPVSLHSLGLVLFIGHGGAPCPHTVEVCRYSWLQIILSHLNIGNQSYRGFLKWPEESHRTWVHRHQSITNHRGAWEISGAQSSAPHTLGNTTARRTANRSPRLRHSV